jgi:phage/conjugal plasmid C-4 type zinc finger TraR family protein
MRSIAPSITADIDEIDQAQIINELYQANALAEHIRRQGSAIITSSTHCVDCGRPIPEARRHAVNGCRRCIDCQDLLENWRN